MDVQQQQQLYLEQLMCKIITSLQQKHPHRVIVHGMNGRHNFWLHHNPQFCHHRQMRHQITPAPNAPNVSPSRQFSDTPARGSEVNK